MLGFTTAEWRRDPFKTLLLENFFRFRSSHLMHLCCLGDSEFNPHQSLLLTGYLPTRGLSPLKTGLLKCTLPLLKESVFPVQVKVNTICISSSSCLSLAQPLSLPDATGRVFMVRALMEVSRWSKSHNSIYMVSALSFHRDISTPERR